MSALDGYELVPLADGVHGVFSHAYQETCHPIIGPEREARRLYVEGLDLVRRVSRRAGAPFVLWDVGMGSAANTLAVLRALASIPAALRVVSFDQTTAALEFALGHVSALPFLAGFEPHLRRLMTERRVAFRHGELEVSWEYAAGNFPALLAQAPLDAWPKPDAVVFDPHSPARNPEMWTLPLFERLHARLDPARPCALSTYSRSTMVRTALLLAGFYVGRGGGAGAKEETTMAASGRELLSDPLDRAWLERIRSSTSAEPLTEEGYRQAPLSAATQARLQAHRQFAAQ